MRTPRRWLQIRVRESVAIIRAVFETADILAQRPMPPAKQQPIIIPGRPQDFGR
jgi:hypothetical protein